ncbi:unnamed protein product [Prorocentrum cordatum]|uniref:Uncharacterized protein n=1 Tax=Prorocentrum cordatum TaxID=2364126 RepID=A0ABN9XL66_9DINO|nr:unnamed protein product [Polarella glacialis]
MWHLNIPLFRNLDKVAEHERRAVLGLARTWWGFSERLPAVLSSARAHGLSPALPAPAADLAREARSRPAHRHGAEEEEQRRGGGPDPLEPRKSATAGVSFFSASRGPGCATGTARTA